MLLLCYLSYKSVNPTEIECKRILSNVAFSDEYHMRKNLPLLARHGYTVKIFEKSDFPNVATISKGQSTTSIYFGGNIQTYCKKCTSITLDCRQAHAYIQNFLIQSGGKSGRVVKDYARTQDGHWMPIFE